MSETTSHTAPYFAGFLQFDVQSGQPEKNFLRVKDGLAELAGAHEQISQGIIVLPELWATGFAYEKLPELARAIPALVGKLQELATQYRVFIAGSLPEFSNNSYFNTLYITGPEGTVGTYRKQRLFSPMQEDTFFSPGTNPSPIPTLLGPIAGLICYDLRFPEILRVQTAHGANLLVIPAQWPAARVSNWRILVQARAIENQIFVAAANRCGITDDTAFGGHSMIVAPDGSILLEAGEDEECRGVMIDPDKVEQARSLFSTVPER